jgi:hypothetical protein
MNSLILDQQYRADSLCQGNTKSSVSLVGLAAYHLSRAVTPAGRETPETRSAARRETDNVPVIPRFNQRYGRRDPAHLTERD